MIVTEVKAAKQHLYTIVFDDGESMDIDKTVWEHSGIQKQDEMSLKQAEELLSASNEYRAREKALYYLSLRDYGSGELVQKLCRVGIDRTLASVTVDKLAAAGLIDDVRYAGLLARDMSTRKLYPKRRIAMALREKGFASDVIEEILLQLPAEEEQQALELLRKKGYNGAADCVKREKALAMLARYGFSYAAAKRALALWEESAEE